MSPSEPDYQIESLEDTAQRGIDTRFQARLLDVVGQAVIATDPQGKIIYWNRAAEVLYGWSATEVMGRSVMEVTPSEELIDRAEEIMAELGAGRSWSGEMEVRRKDGTTFPAMVTDTPVFDEAGALTAIIGISTDITELKNTEELRRSEEYFRALVQNSLDIVTLLGADGTVRYHSPSIKRILGYRLEELVGENIFDYVHPEDLGRVQKAFAESLADPNLRPSAQYRFRHKDGSWRYLESVGSSLLDDAKVGEFVVNSRDVTARVRAEKKIEQQAALLEHTHDAVFMWELGGRIIYWNEGAERLYGWSKDQALGQISHDLLKTIHPFSLEELDRKLHIERHWEGELIQHARDGRQITVESRHNLVRDQGTSEFVLETNQDITERKQAQERLQQAENRYRALVERMPAVVYVQEIGSPDSALYMSPQIETLTGYSPEDCRDPDLRWRMVHPEDRERMQSEDKRTYELDEVVTTEYRVVHREGRIVWVRNESVIIEEEASGTRYWQGFMFDITERKRAEEALKRSEASLAEAQRIAHLGSWEWNLKTGGVYWSEEAYRICGFEPNEFSPTLETVEEVFHPHDRHLFRAAIEDANLKVDSFDFEHRIVRPDGEVRWVHRLGKVVRGEGEESLRIIGTFHDTTEQRVLQERLHYQASHDELTDLPNRRLFVDRLKQALRHTSRRKERKAAVLFMDIDGFKVVNDSLGHEVGDQLLVAVGQRLKGLLRSGAIAARLGGDEFTVLLEGISSACDAEEIADRIIRELEMPFTFRGQLIFVTVSIGIALSDAAGVESRDLLRAADIALYRAKDKGKARYEVFDWSKDVHALERLELENDLRKAIERDELRICYQPVLSLVSDYVAGMEALLRWEHPERGTMSPNEFIPLAEETGLIVPIGRWLLEKACRQAREWQEKYPSDPQLIIGVNLSLRQFQNPGLVEDVARILSENGLDPGNLALEITESVAMHDVESTVTTLEELKALGVWLVIDDYGTGNSSLSYLTSRFNMDHLKIDGAFIREFVEDPNNVAVIPGLIDFAHAVGLRVIAEGVETAEQLRRLKEIGCEFVQGYYFAEPLTAAAASKLLAVRPSSPAKGLKF